TGGGLPSKNVKLVTSAQDPLSPNQREIDQALHYLLQLAGKNNGARRFYFYFSGHGHVDDDLRDEVALCLPHWSRTARNAALSSQRYYGYILKCTKFVEVIWLLDCCRVKQVAAIGKPTDYDCPLSLGGNRRTLRAYASEYLKPAFEGAVARGAVVPDRRG